MRRVGGYAPISSYAAIGDGRSIDWLPLPELDSPSVLGAVLDTDRGGRFALAPELPHTVERRYLPGTNVLERTFSTDRGSVRVSDAMTLPGGGLGPPCEVSRRVEGIEGGVPMSWSVEPRFGYAGASTRLGWRAGTPVATAGGDALAVCAFGAGTPELDHRAIRGRFDAREGRQGWSRCPPRTTSRSWSRPGPNWNRGSTRPPPPGSAFTLAALLGLSCAPEARRTSGG